MRLPLLSIEHRGRVILIGYLFFVALYLGAPRLALRGPLVMTPSPLDRLIPFWPATIVVYLSQFVLLFLALWWAPSGVMLTRTMMAIVLVTLGSVAVFILVPTTIPRSADPGPLFALLYRCDVPTNCFPSLHVALATIAAVFWPRPRTRPLAWLWAVTIALSTLTTKQHYMIDVGGGFVLATIVVTMLRMR